MSAVAQGKKKREELQLPILHFVVADDWLDKLGKSFNIWLKLHTFVDRTDAERDYDRIPMSLEKVWKKLGMSKSTFFRMIRPLWEYGLIDLIEYEESKRNSQRPKNIIVYEYPHHEIIKKYQPLEKIRDWDHDYESASKEFGKTGGRPIQEKVEEQIEPIAAQPKTKRTFKLVRKVVDKSMQDGFKNETVDGFKNETVTVSEIKPNNVSNISNNLTNNSINDSNNSSSSSKVVDIKNRVKKKEDEEKQIINLINDEHSLYSYLPDMLDIFEFPTTQKQLIEIVKKLIGKECDSFTAENVRDAVEITKNGIANRTINSSPYAYLGSCIATEVEKSKLKPKKQAYKRSERAVPFYNWLEQRDTPHTPNYGSYDPSQASDTDIPFL